ncbi:transcription antitermination factor NusB [Frigoriglobus tundricola]|uniref:Transcription antitermination protein NusB n=1 Tax=Frigoriglobus tundricola TaxID=2774151 RepID=A0A6M5YXL5_9BACT|nr:transcription antitermination factor NusB [Frigoriglobus tundricola]QJW98749.1 Transcription termination protein NusB [Frigoriglobus tundricola]
MARRSRAREVTLQLLFQWDQNPNTVPRRAVQAFARERLHGDPEMTAYCLALLDGVSKNKDRIDPVLTQSATNWRLTRMMPVDRNVLRLGTYELLFDPSPQPLEVVINEAIELARRFGSEDSPAFVNGILDRVAKVRTEPPAAPAPKAESRPSSEPVS